MTAPAASAGNRAWLRAAIALAVVIVLGGGLLLVDSDNRYLWLKAFHIVAVIAWMAGLLYLPRLFIYHFETQPGSQASDLFVVMERRLVKIIMNPAMMIAWLLGLYLAWDGFAWQGGWLHGKIACVVLLTAAHVHFSRAARAFGRGERPRSTRHWRVMNEVPALLMIAIVILVVLKGF
jgi:putative membrane protein